MSRTDDPSSRPPSKPALKPVSSRGLKSRPPPPKAEEKPAEEKVRKAEPLDSDFGVAMMIRGTEE